MLEGVMYTFLISDGWLLAERSSCLVTNIPLIGSVRSSCFFCNAWSENERSRLNVPRSVILGMGAAGTKSVAFSETWMDWPVLERSCIQRFCPSNVGYTIPDRCCCCCSWSAFSPPWSSSSSPHSAISSSQIPDSQRWANSMILSKQREKWIDWSHRSLSFFQTDLYKQWECWSNTSSEFFLLPHQQRDRSRWWCASRSVSWFQTSSRTDKRAIDFQGIDRLSHDSIPPRSRLIAIASTADFFEQRPVFRLIERYCDAKTVVVWDCMHWEHEIISHNHAAGSRNSVERATYLHDQSAEYQVDEFRYFDRIPTERSFSLSKWLVVAWPPSGERPRCNYHDCPEFDRLTPEWSFCLSN